MAAEAFAVRIIDALAYNHGPAVRDHDGVHLMLGPPSSVVLESFSKSDLAL
jgi:hypothetical protein